MMIFYAAMAVVAAVWILVLVKTAYSAYKALSNRNEDAASGDQAKSAPAAQPAVTSTIAGMPASQYYSTYWTNTTTTIH